MTDEGRCDYLYVVTQCLSQCSGSQELGTLQFFCFVLFFILFLAALGLRCCAWAFSSCSEQGLLCCGAWASHCVGLSC